MVSILYVDDERDLLELGKIFLEQSPDFTVDIRSSAKEALALPRFESYDVIISDYMMPDLDGIEFLKTVRSISPSQPFILFTGRGREDIVIDAINNGADFYLQKGGDTAAQFAELSHKVRQVVARRDAERALIESGKQLRESEEKFRQLITAAPIPLSVAADDGRIEFINTSFTQLFGYTLEDIPTIFAWFDKACPNDEARKRAYEIWNNNVEKAKNGASPMSPVEYPVTSRDGTVRYVIINSITIKGKMMAAFIDLTERRAAESALQKNREQYQNLVEQANSIILRWGSDGKITFVNSFAQGFFGYTAEELIGRSLVETIVPPTESGSNRDLRSIMEAIIQNPVQYILNENENVKKDGTRVWVQWHNTPLLDDNGQFTGMFSIGFDITDRRDRERTLTSACEDLERRVQDCQDIGHRTLDNP